MKQQNFMKNTIKHYFGTSGDAYGMPFIIHRDYNRLTLNIKERSGYSALKIGM